MIELITFIVIAVIWGYCAATQTAERNQRRQYYRDKMTEHYMKGEKEMGDFYNERLARSISQKL